MSSFVLKLLAMIFMCCDHIGKSIIPGTAPLYYIGACSFPLFAFQLIQGYIHTHNFKNYVKRLAIFALISQIPFMLFLSTFASDIFKLNIFFTLLLGLLAIYIYDNKNCNIFTKLLTILAIIAISIIFKTDYSAWGILLILTFFIFRNKKILLSICFILLCILKYLKYFIFNYNSIYLILCLFTALSLIFILFYNGKRGKKISSFFYMFYPIHLSIIYLIHMFI